MAADNAIASAVGAEVMAAGGNVIDAAVATAFALGVVSPASSGLGGGGFLIYWKAGAEKAVVIDFRETAPLRASRDMYVRGDGRAEPEIAKFGPLAVAVPGEVAGLWLAHKRHGKLPWARVVAPAVRIASAGFKATAYFEAVSARLASGPRPRHASAELRREILQCGGRACRRGATVVRRELARTLALIQDHGADGFYRGPVAAAIVKAMGDTGIVTADDLASYRPVIREAVQGSFMGFDVWAMPPPSSGGAVLVEILNFLGGIGLSGAAHNSSAYLHLVGQALKFGFADRANLLGDEDGANMPWRRLLSKAHATKLVAAFHPRRATPHPDWVVPKAKKEESGGTSHVSVIDADGNAVALTTTINTAFGSMVVAPGTGVILNNEMDDFSMEPGVPNAYGLIGGEANAIRAGKRPLSSMSPTIMVRDGRAALVVGGSGGPRIISATTQVLLNVALFGMNAAEAVLAPRAHHQWVPDRLEVEDGIPGDVIKDLVARGHLVEKGSYIGEVQIVVRPTAFRRDAKRAASGWPLEGASDPRKGGYPAGY